MNFEQSVQYSRYLHARRKKLVLAGIVTGNIFVAFPIHCYVEAPTKNIYKSERENHLSCNWTKE